MTGPWSLCILLLLASCGVSPWSSENKSQHDRNIASVGAKQLLMTDKASFQEMLHQRLHSLHSYYLIGLKNLKQFDAEISQTPLHKLYESESYLNLIAVRTQVEEIEHELEEAWDELKDSKSVGHSTLRVSMEDIILKYAERGPYAHIALENLMHKLHLYPLLRKNQRRILPQNLQAEFKLLGKSKEFSVYEKNVEHISHMLDIKYEGEGKRFYPSAKKEGNITGNEFPAKVWSLTFDDGPGKNTSLTILKNLQERKLKATFFQLTQQAKKLPEVAKEIREAGMEIASHSYTHPQLTKVGTLTLEKETTLAVRELKKLHDREIKFYRLPYGAGVNSPHIREKIAENKLIHVFWNIDTLDWMPQTPDKIVLRTIELMKKTPKDAGVLLFHDIHLRTTQATPEIMDYLNKDGRRVCTLDEIVTQINEGAETVCPLN